MASRQASLHLIIGPMFSGKTTELLRIAKRLKSIELNVLLLNYDEDKRYSDTEMSTHDNTSLPCTFVKKLTDFNDFNKYDIICINEAQFFEDLVVFCKQMLDLNKIVYACGLDGDYKQEKFGQLIDLIPLSDTITKLYAFCSICKDGTHACFTKRLVDSSEQKLIGTCEYIPVCRKHISSSNNSNNSNNRKYKVNIVEIKK